MGTEQKNIAAYSTKTKISHFKDGIIRLWIKEENRIPVCAALFAAGALSSFENAGFAGIAAFAAAVGRRVTFSSAFVLCTLGQIVWGGVDISILFNMAAMLLLTIILKSSGYVIDVLDESLEDVPEEAAEMLSEEKRGLSINSKYKEHFFLKNSFSDGIFRVANELRRDFAIKRAIAGGGSALAAYILEAIISEATLTAMAWAVGMAAGAFLMTLVFERAMREIEERLPRIADCEKRSYIWTRMSAAFLAGMFVKTTIFGINIGNALCVLILLTAAEMPRERCDDRYEAPDEYGKIHGSKYGSTYINIHGGTYGGVYSGVRFGGRAAAVGMIFGICRSAVCGGGAVAVGAFGFCGTITEIVSGENKFAAVCAMVLSNAIFAAVDSGSASVIIPLADIAVASGLYMILPNNSTRSDKHRKKQKKRIRKHMKSSGDSALSARILVSERDYAGELLKEYGKTFADIADIFSDIAAESSHSASEGGGKERDIFFENVINRVCRTCGLSPHCWEKNFNDTWVNMRIFFNVLERKGAVGKCDIPDGFAGRCSRCGEFVNVLNGMYEVMLNDMSWRRRQADNNRQLLRQYSGIANMLIHLGEAVNRMERRVDMERDIVEKLEKQGMLYPNAICVINPMGNPEVMLTHSGYNGKSNARVIMEKTVSQVCGRTMELQSDFYEDGIFASPCTAEFKVKCKFTLEIGTSSYAAGAANGDNYIIAESGDCRICVALCDGMGTGEAAALQSNMATELIARLFKMNMETEEVMSFINSIIDIVSGGESFSTIDLMIFDSETGLCEFVKVGGCPSLVLTDGGNIKEFNRITVPAGMYPEIRPISQKVSLKHGDTVFMCSDGVWDVNERGSIDIRDMLRRSGGDDPQDTAQNITKKAGNAANINFDKCDDMTAVIVRVWEL